MLLRPFVLAVVTLILTVPLAARHQVVEERDIVFFNHAVGVPSPGFDGVPEEALNKAKAALNLSEVQVTAVQALFKMRMEANQRIFQEVEAAQMTLHDLADRKRSATEIGAAFLAVQTAHARVKDAADKFRSDFQALLSTDQRAALSRLNAASEQIEALRGIGVLDEAGLKMAMPFAGMRRSGPPAQASTSNVSRLGRRQQIMSNMTLRKPPLILVMAGILLVLLPLLACLQYQWLGKVSEREREQMQAGLRRNLSQLRQDFDREIARIYLQFQLGPNPGDRSGEEYAKLYAHWNTTAPNPKLIQDIFFGRRAANDAHHLERLNLSSGSWEAADWTTEFGPRRFLEPGPLVDGSAPAVLIPMIGFGQMHFAEPVFRTSDPSRVIVSLNLQYIRNEFIPALVRSHFGDSASEYRIHITDREDSSRVIYTTEPNPLSVGDGDATDSLLALALANFAILCRPRFPSIPSSLEAGFHRSRHSTVQVLARHCDRWHRRLNPASSLIEASGNRRHPSRRLAGCGRRAGPTTQSGSELQHSDAACRQCCDRSDFRRTGSTTGQTADGVCVHCLP